MGRERGEQPTPDLFSTETVQDGSPSPTSPIPAAPRADESSQRHVLPKNLRKAVKHLSDGELHLLHAAILEEMERRGRLPPSDQTTNRSSRAGKSSHRRQAERATVSLTRGQVNAVRAAFKAGITPVRIARQFGISQSDVRKVLASDTDS
jgi:predicted DNA binding protein